MTKKIVLIAEPDKTITARAEGFERDSEILRFATREELYGWLNRLLFSVTNA